MKLIFCNFYALIKKVEEKLLDEWKVLVWEGTVREGRRACHFHILKISCIHIFKCHECHSIQYVIIKYKQNIYNNKTIFKSKFLSVRIHSEAKSTYSHFLDI